MLNKHGSRKSALCLLISIASAAALSGCGASGDTSPTGGEGSGIVGGCSTAQATSRYIVKLKSVDGMDAAGTETSESSAQIEVATSQVSSMVRDASGAEARQVEHISKDMFAVELDSGVDINSALEGMSNSQQVEYVEPDYIVHAVDGIESSEAEAIAEAEAMMEESAEGEEGSLATLNDPLLSKQWAHAKIQSAQAWDISQGSQNIIVGVIDSGVDHNHVDLSGNMWRNPGEIPGNGRDDDGNGKVDDVYGWDFANNDNNPIADDPSSYHGTHCAGTIGAVGNNSTGIAGHSPRVKLMALKFLSSNGSGYTSNAVKAVDYAISKGVKILSNSWGSRNYSQAMADAIGRAKRAGILFVAAAGNSSTNNDTSVFYPANYAYDNVVSVASTTSTDALSGFSNYGAGKVHIGAPGSSIYSTKNGNSYQTLSGTSMATPLVSGVAALMMASRPDLNYLQIKNAMFSSVDKKSSLTGKVSTGGRINAYKALNTIRSSTPPSTPTPDPAPSPGTIVQCP